MSQNKDDKTSRPGADGRPGTADRPVDGGLPKRPVPTIDLKATEIKPEGKGAAPGAASAASSGSVPVSGQPAAAKATVAGASMPPLASKPASPSAGPSPSSIPPVAPKSTPGTKSETTAPQGATSTKPTSTTTAPDTRAATAKPLAASSSPTAAKSGSAIGRMVGSLGAAVVGGLLALFGADFLAQTAGIDIRPNATPPAAVDDLKARLATLEKTAPSAAATRSDPAAVKAVTDQLAQAADRITKLEVANRQLAALGEAQAALVASTKALEEKLGQGAAATAMLPETAGRLGKLEETIQGLVAVAQAQPGRPLPEVARLSTKLNELETAIAALRKGGNAEAAAQIDARLAEARKAEVQLAESMTELKGESTKRLREIEAVRVQAERLEQRVETIKSDAGTARSSVDTLKNDVTTQLQTVARQGDLKATVDVVDKRVAGLETKLEAMAKRDDERQVNAERVVVALQLTNLKRALDQGKPFGDALAEVEKSAGSMVDVGPLKAFRDKGVPSAAELTTQFRQVAHTVLEAEQDKAQASTVDRLINSAKSVVQIRRVGGDVQGDTAEARMARAEFQLKAGDLDAAAKEMKALRPELRSVAQGWLDQLDARVTVDRALKSIEDKLKTAIAGAPAGGKGGNR